MSAAEAIHRAWVIIGIGCVFLALATLQLWAGKAFIGFQLPWHPSPWARRKKEPFLFWLHVGLLVTTGTFGIGLGIVRVL